MSHTCTNLIAHLVFSTKDRPPLITGEIRAELFAYLGGLVRESKGKTMAVNGMPDHVHLLVVSPPAEAMRFVKANSSKWVTERFGIPFAWQTGYGAFSVSRSGVPNVVKYIAEQEAHHRKFDFRGEFVALLEKSEVDFDEKYLWV
jgi:REP element-mobilizing transposase RayT